MTESNSTSFNTVFLSRSSLQDRGIIRLAEWGEKFTGLQTVKGTEGNLSYRTKLGFIITGTNIPLNDINPETVVEVTGAVYGLHKNTVYVKGMVYPSREVLLHAKIYDLRDEVTAIFHVHDEKILQQAETSSIPVTGAEQPAGSMELVNEAATLIEKNPGVRYFILRNHGVVALDTTMDAAGRMIEKIRR